MELKPPLPPGYSTVSPGQIASVVTCLEMRQRPEISVPEQDGMSFQRWKSPDLGEYRALYRAVGENWLWVSRLEMPDDELTATLADRDVETYYLEAGSRKIGFLELDFREAGQCEIVYCGLVASAIGRGGGRYLMASALNAAWSRDIDRLWLHTCHFDHPSAYAFYCRSGFKPFQFMVEIIADPRLSGSIPKTAAPHVALLEA
ncbi:GNAT family N-acetyltransferase [Rhizobium sp. B21/90]|uniref:GNAT family N-acetyltransferase n=1 Tax=Rhizobium sp. B21/90 TaxID=2819993 RepID=UPI001C5AC591|nr:GNAT family N-acetyltransferase [Rhizobium sp. B21/90]QYA03840.1 GNAT family N-acetyltransferase [Rhizobium sp. B21/90]